MIVLGIDPGTRHFGWGLVERSGTRLAHLAHGVIDTDTTAPLAERLCTIEEQLETIVQAHRPDAAVVESIFFGKDASAAAKLGHARGVALLVLARAGLPISEYEPSRIKRAIVGNGRADKRQMTMVVSALLRLPTPPRADAADALAIAIMHANVAQVEARLNRMRSAVRR